MRKTTLILLPVAVGAFFAGAVFSQERVAVETLPFSAAREAGSTLYVSGQIGVTAAGDPVRGSVADETRQCMENLERALKDQGYDFGDVVKVTVFLADMNDYAEMNAAYREFFRDGRFPARECVGGLEIAFGLRCEISCIAYKE